MKRKVCKTYETLIVLVVILFFTSCATSTLQSYEPLSSDEANIKEFLVLMERTWNDKNLDGVLAAYHDNAKIMSGKNRKMYVKKKYAETLRGLKGAGKIRFSEPKRIKIEGDKAEVDINLTIYEHNVVLSCKFILVRSLNGWLIMKRTYTY